MRQRLAAIRGVAILFTVSWLPIGLLLLVTDLMYPPSLENNVSSEHLYLAFAICHIIAMTSAISNPVVYGWLNSNIRRELMQLIPCKCTRPPPEETTAAPSPTMVLCQNGQKRPTHQQPATTYTAL
ncbi:hypothetical protein GE061_012707 [Apolygus lucorum]|uniref:G-protein coupled receptors family 1 profile domain-containing protein n=1 Tax=Apolygus lucorum TaxID=248454 RepID=A0A6A4JYT4_APOLU|nr:hypothetical protein GE061_012707 [Apolygus lucorum]